MISNIEFSRKIIVNNSRSYCDCGYKSYKELVDNVLKDYKNNPYVNITIQTKIVNDETFDILGYININFIGIDKLSKINPFISYGSYGGIQSVFFDGFGFYYQLDENNLLRIEILTGNIYINNFELGRLDNLINITPIINSDIIYQYYLTNIKKENEIPLYITNKNLVISMIVNPFEINFNLIDVVPEI